MSNIKENIAVSILDRMHEKRLSLRGLASKVDNLSYTQVHRITSQENYNIDTLIKVLEPLGLSLAVIENDSRKGDCRKGDSNEYREIVQRRN